MRLLGDEVHSCHTGLTDHEFADHLLADHGGARMAIVSKTGQTHMVIHSRSAKANHAHEYLPRYVCERGSVGEAVKQPKTKDALEAELTAAVVGG
jgi:hypothetical protein